jgi:type VI secretion system protein
LPRLPIALLSLAFLLSGCSSLNKTKAKATATAKAVANRVILRPEPLNLDVGIDPEANKNSPVALDVVLVKDKNFWKTAPDISAKDWFTRKSDLQRRYGKKLQVSSWEWVPGQPIAPITVKVPRWLYGAMVFANYPSPGSHSAPLPAGGKVSISLEQEDFIMAVAK